MRPSTNPSSSFLLASALALCLAAPAYAQSNDPIKIGVIAEVQSIAGAATPGGAQIAADEINAKGGILGRKVEIVTYDNKSSSADSVRAFQRAVSEDKVSAVIASYISEVVLALEPWAARLKMPLITPGAASNEITKAIHNDYEKNKYTFHGYLTSAAQAQLVCDAAKDLLVDKLKFKTVAIMSEDAAWTKPLDVGYEACLPKAGLKVVEHVRFSPDTTDFTPIFNNIEGKKPDVIVTGISHVGDVRHQRAGAEPDLLEGHQWRRRRRAVAGSGDARRRRDIQDEAVRGRVQGQVRHAAGLYRLHRL